MLRSFLCTCLLVLVAACATPPRDVNTMVVTRDLGGMYLERLDRMESLVMAGQNVAIRGTCASACTLYLALQDNVCVHPQARLGFHGPQIAQGGRLYDVPEPERSRVIPIIAQHYPPAFRAWFLANAAHLSGDFAWMNGRDAIALGARDCTAL